MAALSPAVRRSDLMSPVDALRNGYRRILAEEHIVYTITVWIVVAFATFYAVYTHDHSGNIWIVYGTAIGLSKGAGRTAVNTRRGDTHG